jgi:hypothetical protein
MEVLDGPHLRILHPDRLGDGRERLPGGVGDHVQVESALDIHGSPLG